MSVLPRDEHGTAIGPKPVINVMQRQVWQKYVVAYTAVDGTRHTLETTSEHPFWVTNRNEWVAAKELAAGDLLVGPKGQAWRVETSTAEILSAGLTVYDFTVDQAHTYYVAPEHSLNAFVLVHNACTNPYGKKGGPAHQAKTREVIADIDSRGLTFKQEVGITTVNGEKAIRFMDVVAYKNGIIVEIHQVGKTLKTNELKPISRERRALRDIRNSHDVRGAIRYFHSYGTD